MQKHIETGVFIPVGRHGWIHSVNSPDAEDGSYDRVLEVVQGAERLGFDFVLSPAIWRGRKGPSRHWMDSLESMTTTAALLQATSRITVFGTIHMTVYPPATIAKMVSTLDQIGKGRVGLNLVTGSSFLDLSHVGLWNDDLDHDQKYELSDEWIKLVKRYWTEDVISHKGQFFEAVEATMGPKPSTTPQLVNAGSSARGFQFAAENCDVAFIVASDTPKSVETARKAKEVAREMGKPDLKVFGLVTVIPGDTDEEAQALLDHFNAGVDKECVADIAAGYATSRSAAQTGSGSQFFEEGKPVSSVMSGELVGSYETLARRLAATVNDGDLDGLMLIVPDYVKDLEAVATKTLPLLAEYGITTSISQPSTV